MVKVVYVSSTGERRKAEAEPGMTVMETAVKIGIDEILGECGGACACATCHVYVAPEWLDKLPPASPMENDMLDFAVDPRRRRGCPARSRSPKSSTARRSKRPPSGLSLPARRAFRSPNRKGATSLTSRRLFREKGHGAAHRHGREADPRGQQAVQDAFAQPRRNFRREAVAEICCTSLSPMAMPPVMARCEPTRAPAARRRACPGGRHRFRRCGGSAARPARRRKSRRSTARGLMAATSDTRLAAEAISRRAAASSAGISWRSAMSIRSRPSTISRRMSLEMRARAGGFGARLVERDEFADLVRARRRGRRFHAPAPARYAEARCGAGGRWRGFPAPPAPERQQGEAGEAEADHAERRGAREQRFRRAGRARGRMEKAMSPPSADSNRPPQLKSGAAQEAARLRLFGRPFGGIARIEHGRLRRESVRRAPPATKSRASPGARSSRRKARGRDLGVVAHVSRSPNRNWQARSSLIWGAGRGLPSAPNTGRGGRKRRKR